MKTLHLTIRLGVGPDDDGSFDQCGPADIWTALCRAFPFCRCTAIEVEPVNLCDLVVDEARYEARRLRRELDDEQASACAEAWSENPVYSLQDGEKS